MLAQLMTVRGKFKGFPVSESDIVRPANARVESQCTECTARHVERRHVVDATKARKNRSGIWCLVCREHTPHEVIEIVLDPTPKHWSREAA